MSDLNQLLADLSRLTGVEAADRAKQVEEKWGVTAAAAVAAAPAAAGAAPAEEKDEFTIMLAAAGDKKINVIKEVRAITALGLKEAKDDFTIMLMSAGDKKINVIKEVRAATSLGLKEAKDLVEGAPKEVKSGVNKKDADEIKAKLEAAGAKVELK